MKDHARSLSSLLSEARRLGLVATLCLLTVTAACNDGRAADTVTPPGSATTQQPGLSMVAECASPRAGWIWCDDFERDRLGQYFEYAQRDGSFTRVNAVGLNRSFGMRGRFAARQTDAGALHLAFGKTPQAYFRPVDAGTSVYRELFWRLYLRNQPGWMGGGGDKLARAISFASRTTWAQAMIGHVWSGGPDTAEYLVIDPASGTDVQGNLRTTDYNDFNNFRWLGAVRSSTPVFGSARIGAWHCIEAHVRLNDAGQSNGVFELWINGVLEAQKAGLNWLGSFSEYGINALFIENFWNSGSPAAQERYFDNLVVGRTRIGCLAAS